MVGSLSNQRIRLLPTPGSFFAYSCDDNRNRVDVGISLDTMLFLSIDIDIDINIDNDNLQDITTSRSEDEFPFQLATLSGDHLDPNTSTWQ